MAKWLQRLERSIDGEARYTPLLTALFIYVFLLQSLVAPGPRHLLSVDLLASLLILAGVVAVTRTRSGRKRAWSLAALLLILNWWVHFAPNRLVMTAYLLLAGAAILGATAIVLGDIMKARTVSSQTIQGAICGYLLLVICWTYLYLLAELAQPSSFRGISEASRVATDFLYFSFVTQTTLGFGDISPIREASRSLVTLQALVGQFYLAIIVARLVAIQTRGED